jgi:hypothetical protein
MIMTTDTTTASNSSTSNSSTSRSGPCGSSMAWVAGSVRTDSQINSQRKGGLHSSSRPIQPDQKNAVCKIFDQISVPANNYCSNHFLCSTQHADSLI